MSKSRGNVINPDEIIEKYGADTLRLYEMFIGDFEKAAPWSASAIKGCRRFVERVVGIYDSVKPGDSYSQSNEGAMHKTIKKVGDDIENLKFNTAIAAMMTLLNQFDKNGINSAEFKTFITLLNPFAPHITEELYSRMGNGQLLASTPWPTFDPAKTIDDVISIAVQINGKVKGVISAPIDTEQDDILALAKQDEKVKAGLEGMEIVKNIVIKNKIVNFVVRPL